MPYPASFHRLVMIGSVYTDIFNVTLSIVPSGAGALPAVSQALADDVRDAVALWWPKAVIGDPNTGGIHFSSNVILRSIKLNRIGPDGLYQDAEAIESILGAPVAGVSPSNPPAQLTLASTLRGVNERARAGRGRMFWPPTSTVAGVFPDGRLTANTSRLHAEGVRNLLYAINDCYVAASIPAVAGIASKTGTGAFQDVDRVTVGRVVDTMRSRRNKLDEDPQEAVI